MDAFDVRERFAADPLKCIRNLAAKRILREQWFDWHPQTRAVGVAANLWSWNGLRGYLQRLVGDPKLAARFADLLVGYRLVVESEYERMGPTVSKEASPLHAAMADVSKNKSSGRAMRTLLDRLKFGLERPPGGFRSPATSRPQRRESLKVVLSRIMVTDLVASGCSRKFACNKRLPQIWAALAVKVDPESILRMDRRSRKKGRTT